MLIQTFKVALDGAGPARVNDDAAFTWVDGDDTVVATAFLQPSEIAPVGPTVYQIGATGFIGMRFDAPANVTTEPFDTVPAAGTISATVGVPSGGFREAFATSPGFELISSEGDTLFRGEVAGASFGDSLPSAITPGWHTIVLTWDEVLETRTLYLDGELFASSLEEFSRFPTTLAFRGPWDETLAAYVEPAVTLVEFSVHDDVWDALTVDGYHSDMVTALTGEVPLAAGVPFDITPVLRWDTPSTPVDGWLLRVSLSTGGLVEVKLPPETTEYDIAAELGDVSGIAHLHAVNTFGRSAPAEVVF